MFETNFIPIFGTPKSACFDIAISEDVFLKANTPTIAKTGIKLTEYFPEDSFLAIFSRSGMATKGITVINSPGIVDADYRGDVGVILNWNGYVPIAEGYIETMHLKAGTRVAQGMIVNLSPDQIELREANFHNVVATKRGSGGYGSTGS